jgi:SlyX protein
MSVQIEERLAHLERVVDELNTVVAGQSRDIDRLTERVRLLMEREAAREAEGAGGIFVGDERPPHY